MSNVTSIKTILDTNIHTIDREAGNVVFLVHRSAQVNLSERAETRIAEMEQDIELLAARRFRLEALAEKFGAVDGREYIEIMLAIAEKYIAIDRIRTIVRRASEVNTAAIAA